MAVFYWDFSKAFDKVLKLFWIEKNNIEGKALNWIMNWWLKDRREQTVLNGFFSGWSAVESGVPQGSMLGSLVIVLSMIFMTELTF